MMEITVNFTDLQICKDRKACYVCRNDERFRDNMKRQYGDWECPNDIPIGVALEQLPQSAIDHYHKSIEMRDQRKLKMAEVEMSLNDLEMIVPEHGKHLLNNIRNVFMPHTKSAEKCKHSNGIIGQVDEVCCGGKTKLVDSFSCKKHGSTTNKKCIRCEDFEYGR